MWALTGVKTQPNLVRMERFDGIRAIQAHIEQREHVEAYVHGATTSRPCFHDDHCAHCQLRKWLHGPSGGQISDMGLLDELHSSCHDFLEAAQHALHLVESGQRHIARTLVRKEAKFSQASDRYQSSLARLHLSCEVV